MGCCSAREHTFSTSNTPSEDSRRADIPILQADSFIIKRPLTEGSCGKVYSAVNRLDHSKVALKFFGYTSRPPDPQAIQRELELMASLRDIDGIVQIKGYFLDTPDGLVENKLYLQRYPVIVMELLEGGDVFDHIQDRQYLTEKHIAQMFKSIIRALDSLHKRRYIHRDLKLENLMLVNCGNESPVKIIDFDIMVSMPSEDEDTYRSCSVDGSPGMIAPESIMQFEYSPRSDVWQAGCTLYALLSGTHAFSPRRLDRIISAQYTMTGPSWEGISDSAKDLIASLLQAKPEDRLTTASILSHPWLVSEAPDTIIFGEEYKTRIMNLVLGEKLRIFFQDSDIEAVNTDRRKNLRSLLPFLKPIWMSRRSSGSNVALPALTPGRSQTTTSVNSEEDCGKNDDPEEEVEWVEFEQKLNKLRRLVIDQSIRSQMSRSTIGALSSENEEDHDSTKEDHVSSLSRNKDITFSTFVRLLSEVGLQQLANQQVFSIFDIGNTGTVDITNFLLALLAFRPENEPEQEGCDEGCSGRCASAARLYFDMFDINNTGYIDLEEMKVIVRCMLLKDKYEESRASMRLSLGVSATGSGKYRKSLKPALSRSESAKRINVKSADVDTLFNVIDVNKSGKIYFDDFRKFYDTMLSPSQCNS